MRISLALFSFLTATLCWGQTSYMLKADGGTDTYELIENSGFFTETTNNQTPDDFMGHPEYQHISQIPDDQLEQYVFAFDIHVNFKENDVKVTDGNKSELIDRQRNEIKCMSEIPGTVAADGETITYTWKFKLPIGMKTSSEFCHIHQIKGMGSGPEVAHPVITFTCRTVSSGQVFQIINVPYEGASNVNLAQLDLKPLLGKWIEAHESITVGQHGEYHLTLTDVLSGEEILSVSKNDIEIWRDTQDKSTMRGKWGIYRSLGEDLKLLPLLLSERILFADIEASKGPVGVEIIPEETISEDSAFYDLYGRKVVNPAHGIFIRKGKKIIIR